MNISALTHACATLARFADEASARAYLDDVLSLSDPAGGYQVGAGTVEDDAVMVLSLSIENSYELFEDVTTSVVNAVVALPPAEADADAFGDWIQEALMSLTGVGHTRGDSWYDVTVTASSRPDLIAVDRVFTWGY